MRSQLSCRPHCPREVQTIGRQTDSPTPADAHTGKRDPLSGASISRRTPRSCGPNTTQMVPFRTTTPSQSAWESEMSSPHAACPASFSLQTSRRTEHPPDTFRLLRIGRRHRPRPPAFPRKNNAEECIRLHLHASEWLRREQAVSAKPKAASPCHCHDRCPSWPAKYTAPEPTGSFPSTRRQKWRQVRQSRLAYLLVQLCRDGSAITGENRHRQDRSRNRRSKKSVFDHYRITSRDRMSRSPCRLRALYHARPSRVNGSGVSRLDCKLNFPPPDLARAFRTFGGRRV